MGKKLKKNITHVYTTTKIEDSKALWRLYNFIVLLSIAFLDANLNINLDETGYLLLIGAILGVDVPALARRFLKKI